MKNKLLKLYFNIRLLLSSEKDINYNIYQNLRKQFKTAKFNISNITAYRAIRLEKGDSPIKDYIGRYWTIDKNKAFPYGGKGTREYYYIYHATIPLKSIDWKLTLEHSIWEHRHEKEVALKFDKHIKVNKIEKIKDLKPYSEGGKWHFPKEVEIVDICYNCKS